MSSVGRRRQAWGGSGDMWEASKRAGPSSNVTGSGLQGITLSAPLLDNKMVASGEVIRRSRTVNLLACSFI